MFFIYGWGRQTEKDFGETVLWKCKLKKVDTFCRLIRYTTWFTIFFIPIIPYKRKYHLICDKCKIFGRKVESNKDVLELKKLNKVAQKYLTEEVSKEEYVNAYNAYMDAYGEEVEESEND